MYELATFAGAGGGILGGILNGHRCVGAVEIERYPRLVLQARQRDGILPWFPIWDDIKTFRSDNESCREYIKWLISIRENLVISGGFPCQDISCAGKGKGLEGERSGLWFEMARTIREIRPRFAFVENSPLLVRRGLRRVLADFSEMGYNAKWGIISARDSGAPHDRKRIWILANPQSKRESECNQNGNSWENQESERKFRRSDICTNLANANGPQLQRGRTSIRGKSEYANLGVPSKWWDRDPTDISECDMGRVVNGVAAEVDRLKAIGNGQVPAVAVLAWKVLENNLLTKQDS